ncbi:tRNA dihydrouridine synthase [Patescibacteria group bacterium]
MNKGFWGKLNKPFFVLAPMADVTDSAFRQIISKYSKPDVFFTEFVACDGLCSVGRKNLMVNLEFTKKERPIVAQLFGANPDNFFKSAQLVKELGFDGVDINMGCPERNIVKQGAGSALIRTPKLAQEIIKATKEGAGDLPISVKTRIGFNQEIIEDWLPILLETDPALITIHGRTRKEMSKVPNHWDVIKRGVEIAKGSGVMIVGNGDIQNIEEAEEKAKETGVDGVMLGRAVFGNPWLFNKNFDFPKISVEEKLNVALEHTELFEKMYVDNEKNREIFGGRAKNFAIMKKHYKAYVNGFSGAKELRIKLMEAEGYEEVKKAVEEFDTKTM